MKRSVKKSSVFLLSMLLILASSCSIYQKRIATVDEAVMSGGKVKVITGNNESYIFRRLHRENESLYGITRQGSSSAKKLNGEKEGKMLKVPLIEDNIEKIHLKDDTKSTLATIAVPVVILGAVITFAIVSVNNMEIDFGN